jgi:hypothetical protein
VKGAWLDNGLLNVDLVRPPVEARVRNVPIRGPEPSDTTIGVAPRTRR